MEYSNTTPHHVQLQQNEASVSHTCLVSPSNRCRTMGRQSTTYSLTLAGGHPTRNYHAKQHVPKFQKAQDQVYRSATAEKHRGSENFERQIIGVTPISFLSPRVIRPMYPQQVGSQNALPPMHREPQKKWRTSPSAPLIWQRLQWSGGGTAQGA